MMLRQIYPFILGLILMLIIVPNSQAQTNDQEAKVVLRSIGHEFLLQLGDSTSRILPIEKVDTRYAMEFEKEFSFEPDLLQFSTYMILEETKIQNSYIVEVEKCGTNQVVHSFKVALNGPDNNACSLRLLPKDCYVFYFTILKNTPVEQANGLSIWFYLILFIVLLLAAGVIFYLIKNRKSPPPNPDLIRIGQFQFDQKGMKLTLEAQSIDLSSKETDLLYLLFSNENKTLEREYILKVVWGDDGDYVGRTLDVFISKLRKKLGADTSLKIVNIRGVGYRFVMN